MPLVDYVNPDAVDEATRELLESDAERYGEPSLFARVMANNPDVFAARHEYHEQLVGEGDLSRRHAELVYLAVSVTNDCDYCVASHREQLVEFVGVPSEDAAALARGDHAPFDERERAVVALAQQVARDPAGVDAAMYDALREVGFSVAEIVRLVTVATAAVAANAFADAMGIDPADRARPFTR